MSFIDGYKTNNPEQSDRPNTARHRSVRLPFEFGDVVYHRARGDKVAGLVTRYNITQRGTEVGVTWGDGLDIGWHDFFELTEEYSPIS